MFRHKRANTLSHHISTDYDGRALGRDDPLWEHYVDEASKWDEKWMKSWNESMDSILLFAALFSAVVTAFLIESYKNLLPDYEELTAKGMIALVELSRIASGQITNNTVGNTSLPLPSDFKPTKVSIIVNTLWFASLTLSITTALLALLVKQWSEGYLFGHGLTIPCIQARIRQARYDKLQSWKTEEIVLMLPILMHAALWSFLLGLLIFLADLHPTVLAPAMVFVLITLTLYLFTSLAPLAVAFCPYNTPLSGRKLLGSIYWLFHQTDSDQKFPSPPCEKHEKELSENTTPDALTARAVEWLMKHSRDQTSVDIAIRAISSPMLEIQVWKSLAQGSLLALICQRFTSLFNGYLDRQEPHAPSDTGAKVQDEGPPAEAVLYARALANIARYTSPATFYSSGITHPNMDPKLINLNEELVEAVECGLRQLAFSASTPSSNASNIAAAAGITSLSTWYTLIGRAGQTHLEWKQTLLKLIEILKSASETNHSRRESQTCQITAAGHSHHPSGVSGISQTEPLYDDTIAALAKVLPVEISHWRWDLSQEESTETLKQLLKLYNSNLLDPNHGISARGGLAAAIAVLAIMVNDYPDPDVTHDQLYLQTMDYDSDIFTSYKLSRAVYEELRETSTESQKARRRLWRAQWLASICTTDSKFLQKHAYAMLLLGVTGLLESFPVLRLSNLAPDIAHLVCKQLNDLPVINQSRPVTLPFVLPRSFDIKVYAVDTITRMVYSSPRGQPNPFLPERQVSLLQCLSGNKQLWIDCAPQLLLPVLNLLNTAEDSYSCGVCLDALSEYWHTNPTIDGSKSLLPRLRQDWKMFFAFDIPYKLMMLVRDNEDLRPQAISNFRELTRAIPTKREKWYRDGMIDGEDQDYILEALKNMILQGLLPVLAKEVFFGPNLTVWWRQILALPRTLKPRDNKDDAKILEDLKQLSKDPRLERVGALVRSSLQTDLDHLQKELGLQLESKTAEASVDAEASSSQAPAPNRQS